MMPYETWASRGRERVVRLRTALQTRSRASEISWMHRACLPRVLPLGAVASRIVIRHPVAHTPRNWMKHVLRSSMKFRLRWTNAARSTLSALQRHLATTPLHLVINGLRQFNLLIQYTVMIEVVATTCARRALSETIRIVRIRFHGEESQWA